MELMPSTTVLLYMSAGGMAAVILAFYGTLFSAAIGIYKRTFLFLLIITILGGAAVLTGTFLLQTL